MLSSSAGSVSLLERAGSLRFAQTLSDDAFEDVGEVVIVGMKEEGKRDFCFTLGPFYRLERTVL